MKSTGSVSQNPFPRPSVTRADLSKSTSTGPKGMKIVNCVPKDKVKGR